MTGPPPAPSNPRFGPSTSGASLAGRRPLKLHVTHWRPGMRAHYLQHVPFEGLGSIEAVAQRCCLRM